jgi:predicted nucleotidyltransferase
MTDELMQDLPTEVAERPLPEMLPTVPPVDFPPPHGLREFPASRQFCEVNRDTLNVLILINQTSTPEDTADTYFVAVDPPFDLDASPRRTATQVLRHLGGTEIGWVETLDMAMLIKRAIDQTYTDVDAIYQQAIGMRATEYARAEEAAHAYLAADPKPTVVSGYISGHAENNPTGQVQTHEWAAQQIIERADAFRWAELQMRNVRFARQADMRAATSEIELAMAVATWEDFLVWLREMLGL